MKGLTGRPDLRGTVPFPLGDNAAKHFVNGAASRDFQTGFKQASAQGDFGVDGLDEQKEAFKEAFWTYVNTTLKAEMQAKDPNFGVTGHMKSAADAQAETAFEEKYARLYAFHRQPKVVAAPTLSRVKLQKGDYWARRAELARIMGIDDKSHDDHGSNYKPNDDDYDIIKNLLAPTTGDGRARALRGLKETFDYDA